jgi:hypothetical protein
VIAAPPLAGALQVTVAWPLPAEAVLITGALGTVAGVTSIALEALPVPIVLVAVTVKA